jgi:hypothetical protein
MQQVTQDPVDGHGKRALARSPALKKAIQYIAEH